MERTLEVFVCMKQVLDTEVPTDVLRVDPEQLRVTGRGTAPVLDPYAENALRGALELKAQGSTSITVLSVGADLSKSLLQKNLALGADRVLALRAAPAPGALADGLWTARRLAALVRRAGGFDLLLTGRMAADTNAGTTGPALAVLLGIPLVTMATLLKRGDDGQLIVERLTGEGVERLACRLPDLVTVSSEIGGLPPVQLSQLRAAKTRSLDVLNGAALGIEEPQPKVELVALEKPSRERKCRMVAECDARESGVRLLQLLEKEGIV